MFIRSLRLISKGEELIISYRSADSSEEIRLRYLKSVGIDCQCRLCKLDDSESPEVNDRRIRLINTFEKLIKPRILNDANLNK
ncbi:hypothetical protein C1646_701948 [Rhizophagus diaphanus]|nr:hypothetical protein C1646_701948 [Rhizophagus diaphanus] [Rhizophagus sp. MUCL 43196]